MLCCTVAADVSKSVMGPSSPVFPVSRPFPPRLKLFFPSSLLRFFAHKQIPSSRGIVRRPRELRHQRTATNKGFCNSHTPERRIISENTHTRKTTTNHRNAATTPPSRNMPPKRKSKNNPGRTDKCCPPLKTRLRVTDHPDPSSPSLPDPHEQPVTPLRLVGQRDPSHDATRNRPNAGLRAPQLMPYNIPVPLSMA